jgi:hypothetical protein
MFGGNRNCDQISASVFALSGDGATERADSLSSRRTAGQSRGAVGVCNARWSSVPSRSLTVFLASRTNEAFNTPPSPPPSAIAYCWTFREGPRRYQLVRKTYCQHLSNTVPNSHCPARLGPRPPVLIWICFNLLGLDRLVLSTPDQSVPTAVVDRQSRATD